MSRLVRSTSVALIMTLAACGIESDDRPRDIPSADRRDLLTGSGRTGGASTGSARIYLLSPKVAGQAQVLQAVARDVADTPEDVLRALLEGANTTETADQIRSALPAGTRLLSVRLQAGILRIDLSEELQQLSGEELVEAVAQVVLTATELDGVSSVKISVEGNEQQWPAANGELQSRPLTRYDYPGLVLSAQPAYPAIPTPSQP